MLLTCASCRGWVTALQYLGDSRQLLSASNDGRLLCWSFQGTASRKSVEPWFPVRVGGAVLHVGSAITCMAWGARKRLLAIATQGVVHVYRVPPGGLLDKNDAPGAARSAGVGLEQIAAVTQHSDAIRCLLIAEDDKVLSAGHDGRVGVYDTSIHDEGERRWYFGADGSRGHSGAVAAMALDTHSNRLVTGGFDRKIIVWSMDGRMLQEFRDLGDGITGLCYVPATRLLWASAKSSIPLIFDLSSGSEITEFLDHGAHMPPHSSVLQLHYVEQTQEVAATTAAGDVVWWKYDAYAATRVLHGHTNWIECLCAAETSGADWPEIFTAGTETVVWKWELGSQFNPNAYIGGPEYEGHEASVLCMAYGKQGEQAVLVTGSEDRTVRVWSYSQDLQQRINLDQNASHVFEGHTDRVTGVAVAGNIVISASWDASVRFWELDSGLECPWPIEAAHPERIDCLALVEQLGRFATCSADGSARVWDLETRELLHTLRHSAEVNVICWNTALSRWATGTEAGGLYSWSADGEPINESHSTGGVTAICADAAGRIVSASADHAIRVYDESGSVVQEHRGHTDTIKGLAHVRQKDEYVSSSWDGTIRLWRALTESSDGRASSDAAASASASASAAAAAADEFDVPSYADLHPLVVPAALRGEELGTHEAQQPSRARAASAKASKAVGRVENRLNLLAADLSQRDAFIRQKATN